MSENVLKVGTSVDLTGMQSGMPQAATIVEQSTSRMSKAFEQEMAASAAAMKQMQTEMAALQLQVVELEAKLKNSGGHHVTSESTEANHALHLLGETMGVHMPRMVRSYLSSVEAIAPVMAAAFMPLMAVEMVKIIGEIPEAIGKGIDAMGGLTEKIKQAYEAALEGNNKLVLQNLKVQDDLDKARTGGMTGGAKLRQEMEENKESAKRWGEELGKAQRQLNEANEEVKKYELNVKNWFTQSGINREAQLEEATKTRDALQKKVDELSKETHTKEVVEPKRLAIELTHEEMAAELRLARTREEVAHRTAALAIAASEKAQHSRFGPGGDLEGAAGGFAMEDSFAKTNAAAKRDNDLDSIKARRDLLVREHAETGKDIRAEEEKLNGEELAVKIAYDSKIAEIDAARATEEKRIADFLAKSEIESLSRVGKERAERLAEQMRQLAEKTKLESGAAAVLEQEGIAHSTRVYERSKELVQAEFEAKRITVQQKIALLKQLELQEYKTQMAAAAGDYKVAAASKDPEAIAKAQARIQALADKTAVAMGNLNAQASKAMISGRQVALNYMNDISGAFQRGFGQWLEGHKKFAAAMAESFRQMADQFIMNLIRMQLQRLIFDAVNRTSSEKDALVAAKLSAVHAFKSVMKALPFPANVIVAPITAAAMFAGAMAVGSFEVGGVVPKTGMKMVHEGERVLTERQNTTFERLVNNDGGTHNHYHAAPGESPDSIGRNTAAYLRAMRDGRLRYA